MADWETALLVNANAATFNAFVEDHNTQMGAVYKMMKKHSAHLARLDTAVAEIRAIAEKQVVALDHLKAGQDIGVAIKEQTVAIIALTQRVSEGIIL